MKHEMCFPSAVCLSMMCCTSPAYCRAAVSMSLYFPLYMSGVGACGGERERERNEDENYPEGERGEEWGMKMQNEREREEEWGMKMQKEREREGRKLT